MVHPLHRISIPELSLLAGLLLQSLAMAQPQPHQKIEVSKLGPQVGDRVPDFSLRDQTGKIWTLQSIMGPRGSVATALRSLSSSLSSSDLLNAQQCPKDPGLSG